MKPSGVLTVLACTIISLSDSLAVDVFFPQTGGNSQFVNVPFSVQIQNASGASRSFEVTLRETVYGTAALEPVYFDPATFGGPNIAPGATWNASLSRPFRVNAGTGDVSSAGVIEVLIQGRNVISNVRSNIKYYRVPFTITAIRTSGASPLAGNYSNGNLGSVVMVDNGVVRPRLVVTPTSGFVQVFDSSGNLIGEGSQPFAVLADPGEVLETSDGVTFTNGSGLSWSVAGSTGGGGETDFSEAVELVNETSGVLFACFASFLVVAALEPLFRVNEWKSYSLR